VRLSYRHAEFAMSTTFERNGVGTGTAEPFEALNRAAGEARLQLCAPAAGTENNRIVVLLAPEFLIADGDVELVRTTLQSGGDARLLARVRCPAGLGVACDLLAAGLAMDVLLAADLLPDGELPPELAASAIAMPAGSTTAELNDFALALSDMLLTGPQWFADPELVGLAREQHKPVIPAGDGLPPLPIRHPDLAGWLNTQRPHWHHFGCHLAARLEQFWLELFAFDWRGKANAGREHSRKEAAVAMRLASLAAVLAAAFRARNP
jgi:hypothetical protein